MTGQASGTWSFREAGQGDLGFLRRMFHQALYVHGDDPPFPESALDEPELRHYFEGFGERPGDLGLVALRDGRPVGACWMRLFPRDDPGYGWVGDDVPEIAVAALEEERGHGLGTTLIEELLHLAAVRGVARVSLSVDQRSPALRLYERLGFAAVGRDDTSITMVRSTTPAPDVG